MTHHQYPENGDHAASSSTHITPLDQRPDAACQGDTASPNRRQFLAAAGVLAAATLAASTRGVSARTGSAGTPAVAPPLTPVSLQNRRARALEIREQAARYQLGQEFPVPQTNGDEEQYPAGVANYSKAPSPSTWRAPTPTPWRSNHHPASPTRRLPGKWPNAIGSH
jgi:hypothetical protein